MATENNLPTGVRIQFTGHCNAPVIMEDHRPWTNISESRAHLDERTPDEPVTLVEKVTAIPRAGLPECCGALVSKS